MRVFPIFWVNQELADDIPVVETPTDIPCYLCKEAFAPDDLGIILDNFEPASDIDLRGLPLNVEVTVPGTLTPMPLHRACFMAWLGIAPERIP